MKRFRHALGHIFLVLISILGIASLFLGHLYDQPLYVGMAFILLIGGISATCEGIKELRKR